MAGGTVGGGNAAMELPSRGCPSRPQRPMPCWIWAPAAVNACPSCPGGPRLTVATEAWPPNLAVAAARLRPLGIPVVQDEGAPDNTGQTGNERGRLPFRDGAFGLVASRHEAFRAAEVSRVLAPGGTFITQQIDFHSYDDLCTLVGLDVPQQRDSWLPLSRQQVQDAGLAVGTAVCGEQRLEFHDIAAVVYYLRVVSWAIPHYRLDACAARLRAAHDT